MAVLAQNTICVTIGGMHSAYKLNKRKEYFQFSPYLPIGIYFYERGTKRELGDFLFRFPFVFIKTSTKIKICPRSLENEKSSTNLHYTDKIYK